MGMIATAPDVTVDLAPNNPRELVLRNPVIPASGCFGYGQEFAGAIDPFAPRALLAQRRLVRRHSSAGRAPDL